LDLLKENSPVDQSELKGRSGPSNKKWVTAIIGLDKNYLAKVEKTEEGLFVTLVQRTE
jgi:lysyl-tRNA synthetase class 2